MTTGRINQISIVYGFDFCSLERANVLFFGSWRTEKNEWHHSQKERFSKGVPQCDIVLVSFVCVFCFGMLIFAHPRKGGKVPTEERSRNELAQ
jgi:hypothetical protein